MLEIIPSEGDRGSNKFKDPGIRHLAIAVDDFDQAREALIAKGVPLMGDPIHNQGNRLQFFADLDGNLIHLIARPQPLP